MGNAQSIGISHGLLRGSDLLAVSRSSFTSAIPFLLEDVKSFPVVILIGVVIAYPMVGPRPDAISQFMRRRSSGHQPEHRMPALFLAFLICPRD